MAFISLEDIKNQHLFPGFVAKLIHTDGLTIAYFTIAAGSTLPEHKHIHEQVSNILEGEFEMTIDGETMILKPGTVAVIPSNTPHAGKAITDCIILDVFNPVREDYKS